MIATHYSVLKYNVYEYKYIYIYISLSLSFSLINSHYEQDMVVEHAQNAMGWSFYLRTG